jgi:ring-1,2-phenylacetyl-CoA epoxidase subunit PaaC
MRGNRMNELEQKKLLAEHVIALGDDALILSQRLIEWCSNAPFLEEDLALSNVALDFLGRARMLYQYAVELEGNVRTEDDIAFLRDSREFKNHLIYELPRGDFAFSMARQLIIDVYNSLFLEQLLQSKDERLAAIAEKSIKETQYHLRRSQEWAFRLGDGTEESHQRLQTAMDDLWGYSKELFESHPSETSLIEAGIAVDRTKLQSVWRAKMNNILAQATLEQPDDDWHQTGGRDGLHSDHLGLLLPELQFMQRAYPDQQW